MNLHLYVAADSFFCFNFFPAHQKGKTALVAVADHLAKIGKPLLRRLYCTCIVYCSNIYFWYCIQFSNAII